MAIKLSKLGRAIREARENSGHSQESAAAAIDISRPSYIQIEKGEQEPRIESLYKLADLFGVSVDNFLLALRSDPQDSLVALLRLTAGVDAGSDHVQREISKCVRICRTGAELERSLGLAERIGPPSYEFPAPRNMLDAVSQGALAARQERHRLDLGNNPIPDMSDLIAGQRVWATGAELPDSISGLFLKEESIGLVILVNVKHPRSRKRFSYAHEYAHALLDRDSVAVSTTENRENLVEVRANAFAAAFLLPPSGIHSFFRTRGKGLASKQEALVYDYWDETGEAKVKAKGRTAPGSQIITFHDVAMLADHFSVSYESAVYRLRTENLVNATEMKHLLEQVDLAAELAMMLLPRGRKNNEEVAATQMLEKELNSQILSLSFEALRRELITESRFVEIANELDLPVTGDFLLPFAKATAE